MSTPIAMKLMISPKYVLLMLVLPPQFLGEKFLFFSTLINSEDQNSQDVKSYPVKVQHTPKPWAQAPDKRPLINCTWQSFPSLPSWKNKTCCKKRYQEILILPEDVPPLAAHSEAEKQTPDLCPAVVHASFGKLTYGSRMVNDKSFCCENRARSCWSI